MKPPLIDMLISQALFWGVVGFSLRLFIKYRKADNLPIKRIQLWNFGAIFFCYLIGATHYLLFDVGVVSEWTIYERIVANAPMFYMMWLHDRFLREDNN